MIARLSPIESFMWGVGHDPTLRMTVGDVMILDRPLTSTAMRERLVSVAAPEPRLRQRQDDPTRLRRRPAWVVDPDFDVRNHLRTMTVPRPAAGVGNDDRLDVVVEAFRAFVPDMDKVAPGPKEGDKPKTG